MNEAALNLCGRTSLWTLGALVEGAEAVVCNDTGLSHIATALQRPSVVIACGSDTRRWAPLDATRHRVLAQDLPCRPCAHRHCPTAHECASAISVEQVLAQLDAHFERHFDEPPAASDGHAKCPSLAPPRHPEPTHA